MVSNNGIPSWSLRFTRLIRKYSQQLHHINNNFSSKYGANLPNAIYTKILLQSKQTTNMGVHIRHLKLHNKIKMLVILFNLKIFLLDIPRLFKAVKRTIYAKLS